MGTAFALPTQRPLTQNWMAEFDDWDGDGRVDYPGGFYHSIGWDGHNGLDFGTPLNDPIYASGSGVVEFAGWAGSHWLLSGGGNVVLLAHAEYGVRTEYLHLNKVIVRAGQTVGKGQLLGYGGKTGAATGYHLHFGFLPLRNVNINNRARGRIDPWVWLTGGLGAVTTASAIIDKLRELGVALELKDLEAVQGIVQTERNTIVNEIRVGNAHVLSELSKKIESGDYQIKRFVQDVVNPRFDQVVNDNRAEEAKTREQLAQHDAE